MPDQRSVTSAARAATCVAGLPQLAGWVEPDRLPPTVSQGNAVVMQTSGRPGVRVLSMSGLYRVGTAPGVARDGGSGFDGIADTDSGVDLTAARFGGTAVQGIRDETGTDMVAEISPKFTDQFLEALRHPEKQPVRNLAAGDDQNSLVQVRLKFPS